MLTDREGTMGRTITDVNEAQAFLREHIQSLRAQQELCAQQLGRTPTGKAEAFAHGGKPLVFFGGAGVSTASGIPDFRSADGLYHQQAVFPPEYLLSHTCYEKHPEEFFEFYRSKMLPLGYKPNQAHIRLAELEREGILSSVITQNIDGLHQAAGSQRVLELHGTVHRNICTSCNRVYSAEEMSRMSGVATCACGGTIKPDVVLYEEPLDDQVVSEAVQEISQAQTLIIGGTSLTVWPAAGLIEYFTGSTLIVINRDPTFKDAQADVVITCSIADAFAF